ncbi:MAG TPA: 50S ribosomal protein L1 [Candidatus Thermoplasmatota archaeon]|nr:50S ribosomal protein L1 [Candidatus Thermoplasmatota archaeon]
MVDRKDISAAIKAALEAAPERKFPESVEIAFNLKNVDLSIPKNRVDEEIQLPKGRGRTPKVAVFAGGELAVKARSVADLVVMPEQIEELAGDKRKARKVANDVQFFVAEAPLMPTIGRTLGTVLGPRGKMPRPIPPAADPAGLVNALKNTVRVRSRDRRTFHTPIGVRTMSVDDLTDNAALVIDRVTKKLERGTFNIASIYVKTTMGPAHEVKVV